MSRESPIGRFTVVSGGQTGVDRAALDAALDSGLPCGGWCPRGRKAEDGTIPDKYPLSETESANYAERTERNVADSDGTLIVTWGSPTGGTRLTVELARKHHKPVLIIDLTTHADHWDVVSWLARNRIVRLNVAGPRGSSRPDTYQSAYDFLSTLFQSCLPAP